MAGAGYKLFNTGDVLTAAQVNTYLQEQVVMVFANAAARTTALSGVLAEGMVSYLKDTDALEIYSGSAWVGYGSGDITGVTTGATSGLTGGVTSGTADLKLNTTAKGGLLVGTGSGTSTELAVGSNNTVLTADSSTASGLKWATASSGGITLIQETVASALTSLTFGSISSSYKDLILVYGGLYTSDASSNFAIRFNNNSGTVYYANAHLESGSADGSGTNCGINLNTGHLVYSSTTSTIDGKNWAGTLRIYDYASTSKFKRYDWNLGGYSNADGYLRFGTFRGTFGSTSAISSIDIYRTGGSGSFSNVTNTSIRLYGVA